nr:MAG TPA: hypothetical protein [Caudoviricetes sp.]
MFGGPGEIWGPHLLRKGPPWLTHRFVRTFHPTASSQSARR